MTEQQAQSLLDALHTLVPENSGDSLVDMFNSCARPLERIADALEQLAANQAGSGQA